MVEIVVALGLYNRFHPKYLTTMEPALERLCSARTVQCLNLANCFLPLRGVCWPDKVAHPLTPGARWRGWSRQKLSTAGAMLEGLGFVPSSIPDVKTALISLAGGPSKITKAWGTLTILRERELLRSRLSGQHASITDYLLLAMELPKDSLLHAFLITGNASNGLSLNSKLLLTNSDSPWVCGDRRSGIDWSNALQWPT